MTRSDYVADAVLIGKKDFNALFSAVDMLSPVPPTEEFSRPHQMPRGYKDVRYYQGTNESAIVCAYLPEKSERWSFAAWTLVDGDDFDERLKTFEDEFLVKGAQISTSAASQAPRQRRGILAVRRRRLRPANASYFAPTRGTRSHFTTLGA